jgi:hypothetical protein
MKTYPRSVFAILFALSFAISLPALALEGAPAELAGKQILSELSSSKATASIFGTTQLWTDIVLQTPKDDPAFQTLNDDIQNSDLEAQLQASGFKVMDPAKHSWARGLRPTLEIMVLRAPVNYLGSASGFYLVMASAIQDVKPLGADHPVSLATWCHVGEALPLSGDSHKDVDAIRASVRQCVRAFIDAADGVENPVESPNSLTGSAKP